MDESGRESSPHMNDYDFLSASGFGPHESSPGMGQASKKGGRQTNFTNEEDKLIVSAWLNISLDPILGSGQKKTTFWEKVVQYFNDNKTWPADRSSNSLMNRWSTINGVVAKFIGCYEDIQTKDRSGTTEEMRIADAKTMFHACHKVFFVFEHCWRLLRYEQKWLDKVAEAKRLQQKKKKDSPILMQTVNLDEDVASPESVTFVRPIGRKAAKKQKSDDRADSSNSKMFKVMMSDIMKAKVDSAEQKSQMYERSFGFEQERINMERERIDHDKEKLIVEQQKIQLEQQERDERINMERKRMDHEKEKLIVEQQKIQLEQQERDERILMMDTSMMPPDVQEYYRRKRMDILARSE